MKGFYLGFCSKKMFLFSTWKGNYQRKIFCATQYIDPKLNVVPLKNNDTEIQKKLNEYYFNTKKGPENEKLEEIIEGRAKLVYRKAHDVKNEEKNFRENLFYNPTLVII